MGLRAKAIKKYVIEYGDAEGFNYDSGRLENIINDYCQDFYCGPDGCESTDVIWEIDKTEFSFMIEELEKLSEEEFNEKMKDDWSTSKRRDNEYTKENVLKLFRTWLKETPDDSNYVRLAWF